MKKRETTSSVLMKNGKSRTRDFAVDSEAERETFDKLCLSGAEIANQAQDRCQPACF